MLLSPHLSFMFGGGLVELEASIRCGLRKTPFVSLALPRVHRRKASRNAEVLPQHFPRIDAGNGSAHAQAHRVTQGILYPGFFLLDDPAVATQTLHPDRSNVTASQLGEHQ